LRLIAKGANSGVVTGFEGVNKEVIVNDVFFLRGEDGELRREVAFKSAASTLGMPALAETFTHFHRDFHAVKVTVKLRGSIEPLPCEPQTFTPARQGASKMAIPPPAHN
jgi:hypothetical protein